MKIIEIPIQNYYDREKLILSLAQNGFKVWVSEKEDPKRYLGKLFYVNVEVNDKIRIVEE